MKAGFSCALIFALCFGNAVIAQKTISPPSTKRIEDSLNRIFGVCGCTNCDGLSEHNNPVDDEEFTNGFSLNNRWSSTVLSGGGLTQGAPTMITWSIIPDGTDANGAGGFVPSNMVAFLDNIFNEPNAGSPDYTNRIWWARMQQALDRWGELSGVEYVYEPNDDGAPNFNPGGVLGVRGDVRIGGYNIDGPGGTLAFNFFPNVGDMAIDTGDAGTFGNPQINYRLFRNIISHEQGHGLGFFHIESNNAGFLMEPFISGAFDGPQLDDIRAVHRHYGDVFEKSNNFQGNNTIANATPLGTINIGSSITRGIDGATGTIVSLNDDDFLSVDDNGDTDFYEFVVPQLASANITLTPVGASYNQSVQGGGGGNPTNPSNSSNLTLGLFGPNQNPIAIVNNVGVGEPEVLEEQVLAPGSYYVRATGSANTIQLYTIQIELDQFVAPNQTPPASVVLSSGQIASGSVADLADSDDDYLELLPNVPGDPNGAEISALFTVISPDTSPSSISIDIEMSGNTPNVEGTVSIFNTVTNQFEDLDSSQVSFTDESMTLLPGGSPGTYVNLATGVVLIELKFETTGPTLMFPWTIRVDELLLNTSQ